VEKLESVLSQVQGGGFNATRTRFSHLYMNPTNLKSTFVRGGQTSINDTVIREETISLGGHSAFALCS
jgi:hypothetical protein